MQLDVGITPGGGWVDGVVVGIVGGVVCVGDDILINYIKKKQLFQKPKQRN